MRRHLAACLFAALGLLHAPLATQGQPATLDNAIAALPDHSSQAKMVKATPGLWVVKDEDTTIYMFGTLHLMRPQIDWFNGPVRTAYAAAGEVVTELGVTDDAAIAQQLMEVAPNRGGPPLTPELTEPQNAALTRALAESGMAPAAADALKPWFMAMILTVSPLKKLGFDPKLGADAVIQEQAKADGKPVSGLETASEQFALFDGLPRPLQVQLLLATVDEADQLQGRVETMLGQWSAGDAEGIAAMLNEETAVSADLSRILLTERNARWAEWIRARLEKPGTVFMAVGAGHLAGKGSVQEALAERGVASERVPNP